MPYFRPSPLKTGKQAQFQALPIAVASQEFSMEEEGNSERKRKDGGLGCKGRVVGHKEEGAGGEKQRRREEARKAQEGWVHPGTDALCC